MEPYQEAFVLKLIDVVDASAYKGGVKFFYDNREV